MLRQTTGTRTAGGGEEIVGDEITVPFELGQKWRSGDTTLQWCMLLAWTISGHRARGER